MPRSQEAQFSFAAGVLSPRMAMRADLPAYRQGLVVGQNFLISPQGGIVMREGFEYVEDTAPCRLFQFHRGGDQSDLIVQVRQNEVRLLEDFVEVAVFTDFVGGPTEELYFCNSERVGIIASKDFPPYYITVTESGTYAGEHLPFERVPQVVYFDDKSPQKAALSATYTVTIPTGSEAWFAGMRFVVIYGNDIANEGFELPREYQPAWSTTDGGGLTAAERNAQSIANGIKGTIHMLSNISQVTPTANSLTSYTMLVEGPGAGKTLEILPVGATGPGPAIIEQTAGAFTEGSEPAWSYANVVTHNGGVYYECLKPHFSATAVNEPVPGGNEFWLELAGKPTYFDYQYPDGNAWADEQAYGPWGRGWPQTVTIFQQRVVFATVDDQPTTLWGSRIGDYRDFQPGVNAADPFFFDLDTSDSPKIKWLEPTQAALIVGTSAGDFRAGAEVAIGPADVQLTKQNSARSFKTRAVSTHNTAFYVEQGRTKIRATVYGRQRNAWTSEDVSLAAEHLFRQKVRRIVLMETPEELAFVLRDDGNLVVMHRTDSQNGNVIAWTEIVSRDNHFITDIAVNYSLDDEEDELVAYVFDPDSGVGTIERMPYPHRVFEFLPDGVTGPLADNGIVLLDSWRAPAQDADGNLDVAPLSGTVTVLENDNYLGEFVVNPQGLVNVGRVLTGTITVGYGYRALVEPFEKAEGNPRGVGYGTKRRWNRLYVRILDSALPLINGRRPSDRSTATAMGNGELLRQGIQDLRDTGEGYANGIYRLEQDRPYPTHILGIYGEYQVDNA